MKEHPIIFSDPMVQAILQNRKTQTRRIIKKKEFCGIEEQIGIKQRSHLFQPTDVLWVKETWRTLSKLDDVKPSNIESGCPIQYRADGHISSQPLTETFSSKWRTSLFMPRWCSRIDLKITNIRCEQLQQLTEEDAVAEGVPLELFGEHKCSAINAYHAFWDQMHGPESWRSNPLVRVIEFEVITTSPYLQEGGDSS